MGRAMIEKVAHIMLRQITPTLLKCLESLQAVIIQHYQDIGFHSILDTKYNQITIDLYILTALTGSLHGVTDAYCLKTSVIISESLQTIEVEISIVQRDRVLSQTSTTVAIKQVLACVSSAQVELLFSDGSKLLLQDFAKNLSSDAPLDDIMSTFVSASARFFSRTHAYMRYMTEVFPSGLCFVHSYSYHRRVCFIRWDSDKEICTQTLSFWLDSSSGENRFEGQLVDENDDVIKFQIGSIDDIRYSDSFCAFFTAPMETIKNKLMGVHRIVPQYALEGVLLYLNQHYQNVVAPSYWETEDKAIRENYHNQIYYEYRFVRKQQDYWLQLGFHKYADYFKISCLLLADRNEIVIPAGYYFPYTEEAEASASLVRFMNEIQERIQAFEDENLLQ